MIAFVTGGTGFVGGHLCEHLRIEGWEVRALVRSPSRGRFLEEAGCELVRGTLFDEAAVRKAAGGADVVFHVAGLTKALDRREFLHTNAGGTKQVLLGAHDGGFGGRFVLVSSQAAAGPARDGRPLTERDSPRPVSDYGRSKAFAEKIATRAREAFPVTILRPGAIYGPREHEMYQIIRPLARTGVALSAGPDIHLQLTHVEDVVKAIALAGTHPSTLNKTYFATDDQAWRYSQVIGLLGEALGRPVRRIPVPLAVGWAVAAVLDMAGAVTRRPLSPFGRDKMRELGAGSWLADSSALRRDAGWRARWSLPEGLADTISWYRANGWLPS